MPKSIIILTGTKVYSDNRSSGLDVQIWPQFKRLPGCRRMNTEAATLRGWSLSGLSDCFYQDQDTLSYDTVNLDVQVIGTVLRKC